MPAATAASVFSFSAGLDRLLRDQDIGVGRAQRFGQHRPFRVRLAALGPDEAEDGVDGGEIAVERDGQAQDSQRVEGVGRRHPEGHAEAAGRELAEPVGPQALGRQFGRAQVAGRVQQAGEQHRHRANFRDSGKFAQPLRLQIGVGRDVVEIPVDPLHASSLGPLSGAFQPPEVGELCSVRCECNAVLRDGHFETAWSLSRAKPRGASSMASSG